MLPGTADIKASATLTNSISVEDTQTVQTTAVKPTIDLVVRDQSGAIVTSFGANQDLTVEATVSDHDGSVLDTDDAGAVVTFDVGTLGTTTNTTDVTELSVCPVNGIKANDDCAWIVLTSNATAAVAEIVATATINSIDITDTVTVTNTGVNSGSPDQNSFTITRIVGGSSFAIDDTVAIEGDQFNNQEATVRVDLADFSNNPVPDGTLVTFETELGDIQSECSTTNGTCDVIFVSADPRAPDNTEVNFRNLDDDNCPSEIIEDEVVTIASGKGLTDYRVKDVIRVNLNATTTVLTETTNYTVTSEGIDCVTCLAGQVMEITYRRLWLDEEDDGTSAHVMVDPGEATEPFLDVAGTPCLAPAREELEEITGSINPSGSTSVGGVGTSFESQLAVGDRLKVSGEIRTITSIASDVSLQVDTAFTDNLNDVSPERVAAPAYLGGMGQPYGGRSTILAYALGEESFVDVNGNDEYDFGETFFDLTEAILDKNEDGVLGDVNGESGTAGTVGPYRDAGLGTAAPGEAREKNNPYCYGPQTIIGNTGDGDDSTEAGTYCYQDGGEEELFIDVDGDGVMDVGNGIYNGSRCLSPLQDSDGDTEEDDTVCTTDLVNISRTVQILMAGSFASTEFRAGSGDGTYGFGEIIGGIGNRGGSGITESIPSPEGWSSANTTVAILGNSFGARINTQPLDTNLGINDTEEDVAIFSVTDPFSTTQATFTLSFQITAWSAGFLEVFVGGQAVTLDAACGGGVMTCTATGFSINSTSDLIFAVDDNGSGNFRFSGEVNNITLSGTTTGIAGDFRSSENLVSTNLTTTVLTDFNVGETINATTALPGVSERQAPSGVVPTLTTSLTSGTFWFTDRYNGQLPEGTTVVIDSDNRSGCSLSSVGGVAVAYPIPGPLTGGIHSGQVIVGSTAATGTTYTVQTGGGGSGTLTATVTTPSGTSTADSISCNLVN